MKVSSSNRKRIGSRLTQGRSFRWMEKTFSLSFFEYLLAACSYQFWNFFIKISINLAQGWRQFNQKPMTVLSEIYSFVTSWNSINGRAVRRKRFQGELPSKVRKIKAQFKSLFIHVSWEQTVSGITCMILLFGTPLRFISSNTSLNINSMFRL